MNCTSSIDCRIDSERSLSTSALNRRRQLRGVVGDLRLDVVDHLHRVGVGLAKHGEHDGALVALPRGDLLVLDRIVDVGYFAEPHRRAVAPGDDEILVLVGVQHLPGGVDRDVLPLPQQCADRRRGIGGRHRGADIVERQSARGGGVGIDGDPHREFLLAEDQHLGDAGDLRNLLGEHLLA